jgi:hypothetical protein
MSTKTTAAIVATTLGTALSAGAPDATTGSTAIERADTIAALRDFDANRNNALASLAEKLKAQASELPVTDAVLLSELLAASEQALKEWTDDNALTAEQRAYLKPVQRVSS